VTEAIITFRFTHPKERRFTRKMLHKQQLAARKEAKAADKRQMRLDQSTARRTGSSLAVFEGWVEKTKGGNMVRHPGVNPTRLSRLLGEEV
jgi:hypothetical protein